MAIVGFNFTKINVERSGPVKGKIDIKNNVKITGVTSQKLALGSSAEDGLRFTYEFISKYEPKVAKIELAGDVITLEPKETAAKILEGWKKNKRLTSALMAMLLNTILTKCNIKALMLSQDMNLPPPIPLPKVQAGKKAAK